MKIVYITAGGKTDSIWIELESLYLSRIKHYIQLEYLILAAKNKNYTIEKAKANENSEILKLIQPNDFVVLLDEKGTPLTSKQFADFIENQKLKSSHRLVFISGGAYGFVEELYERANFTFQLSKMTFTHQMVRIVFLEQLYRANTIIKGEKYHH